MAGVASGLRVAAAAACLAGLGLAADLGSGAEAPSFEEYLKEHGLTYWGGELEERRGIYEAALKHIEAHNAKKGSLWKAGVSRLTVMRSQEKETLFGYMKETGAKRASGGRPRAVAKAGDLPEEKDWREHRPNVVTAVKNQGACGSCWAFAATAVMETAIALATDTLFDLSPQQLTSCTPNPQECGGSGGCMGATAQLAFNYTIRTGLTSQWSWPYTSGIWRSNGECYNSVGRKAPVAGISGYTQLPQNDAQALLEAVQVNPVSVSVAASDWHWYSTGIFDGCSLEHPIINHAVVLMGYGKEGETHYWLIRNSWGPTWGERGYIRLQRFPGQEPCGEDNHPLSGYSCKSNPPDSIHACGMCGVLSDSAYPTGGFLGAPLDPEDPAIDTTQKRDDDEAEGEAKGADVISDAAVEPGEAASLGLPRVAQVAPSAVAAAAAAAMAVMATALTAPAIWRRTWRALVVPPSYDEVLGEASAAPCA